MNRIEPPRIYTCAEWSARPVTRVFPAAPAVGIVTHHTTSPNVTPLSNEDAERERCFRLARAIQQEHMNRKPPYADTGQHFLLTRSGLILEGRHGSLAAAKRGRCVQGAHSGVAAINRQWLGIEWEGRYDQEFLVTPVQWAMGVRLCAWLAFWGRFDTASNEPHRHFKATACPGLLARHLPELRREAHDLKVQILASAP